MTKRWWTAPAAVFLGLSLVLSACADETEEGDGTTTTAEGTGNNGGGGDFLACQVTDTGGVNDKSFNQTANEGLKRAESELGIQGKVLESKSPDDIGTNIKTFLGEDCDIIIPVGFLAGDATAQEADANPEQLFAIVDFDISQGNLTGEENFEDVTLDNVKELTFATDEAAFLAGYVAAGMSKSGKVATYGGINIPTVTIFMDGFLKGVEQYNEDNGTDVAVLGWDGSDGQFAGTFEDQDKGRAITESFLQEGADIILPVAGPVGGGTVAAVKAANNPDLAVIWVDVDGCESRSEDCQYFLTSVEKKMDNAVFAAIDEALGGNFEGGKYVGTLENEGVGISPFNQWDDRVPAELKEKVEEYREKIASGEYTLD